jgi:hypothetical protein
MVLDCALLFQAANRPTAPVNELHNQTLKYSKLQEIVFMPRYQRGYCLVGAADGR